MTTTTDALKFMLANDVDSDLIAEQLARLHPRRFLELTGLDTQEVVQLFVKAEPNLFMSAAQMYLTNMKDIADFSAHLRSGNMVSCIKILRDATKLGLKDAKDIVVELRTSLATAGKLPSHLIQQQVQLDTRCRAIHDALFHSYQP